MKKSVKNFILLSLITVLICAGLFEGACILFGADVVYTFCVGVVLIVGLPLMVASRKPQPYWERN